MEGDAFGTILEIAGSGRGAAARIRLWSLVVLVLMALLAVNGLFMMLYYSPTTVTAAEIEDGRRRLSLAHWSTRSRYETLYEIKGHLLATDAIVVPWGASRRVCAPLVSERSGAETNPRIYFEASESDYRRAISESSFVGVAYDGFDSTTRAGFHEIGHSVPDVYVLKAKPGAGASAAGRSLFIFASVVGGLAFVAFLLASRRPNTGDE